MDSHSTIAVALSQALAARDEAALSNCLDVQEAAVVAGSVARLTAAQAALLLEELVARLHTQPQQAARLTPWLRSLLLSHGAVLAAGPAGQAMLRRAQALVEQRTAAYGSLLELSGRVAMLQAAKGAPEEASASPAVLFSA